MDVWGRGILKEGKGCVPPAVISYRQTSPTESLFVVLCCVEATVFVFIVKQNEVGLGPVAYFFCRSVNEVY